MLKNSLYLHIPFCRSKCPYCAFYSVLYSESFASSYIDIISKRITSLEGKFHTIYIGGGTPSVLSLNLLEKLLDALGKYSHKSTEFTIEINPESLDAEKISLFFEKKVNRISVGAQSFDNSKLKKLERIHNAYAVEKALSLSREKGFKNLSIDLIFGVVGEDLASWKEDLKKAVDLDINHISCYSLYFEGKEESALARDMYECAIAYLSDNGFSQYEISSFSKDGCACRHNLNYWENNAYIGLGPSAVSYLDGVREENVHDVEIYMNMVQSKGSAVISSEKLPPQRRAQETAALKIRTMEGIDFDWFREKTHFQFLDLEKDVLPKLVEEGFLEYIKRGAITKGIRLTHKGILFCDIVSSAFL